VVKRQGGIMMCFLLKISFYISLTKIEIRAFKELFFNAGAREVKLYDLDGNSIEE
jgi:hypothetical protein